ncbi:23S rRNA (adenine(2503)-C(2))-methyltransferase RlmN, partial [Intestinimonas butyriciproducens]|nr:23S rRNA (adenine(2503)-C(2))-methyltransferase RlmN [Intestinimonas butyriciproducens]
MYNILDFSLDELKKWMTDTGESSFRAKQVMDWLYKNQIWDFDNMKNI